MMRTSCNRRLGAFLCALVALAISGAAARAAIPDSEAVDPIEQAIRNGAKFLYAAQKQDNWEMIDRPRENEPTGFAGGQWGGLTALALNGLAQAGEPVQDRRIAAAVAFLSRSELTGTRALAIKASMMRNLTGRLTQAQKNEVKKDATRLINGTKTDGDNAGFFGPGSDANQANANLMISNDAVLGTGAAVRMNFEVPTKFWKTVDQAWRKRQAKDGGWSEAKAGESSVRATAAGVATLLLINEMLSDRTGSDCKGNFEDAPIASGIKWLDGHADEILKDPDLGYLLCTLQRVEHAWGQKYFGKLDWNKAGIAELLKTQKADGSWEGSEGSVAGTAWALMFLGTQRLAPVMMNKLAYKVDKKGERVIGNWNERPRDLAGLAGWLGPQLCGWNLRWNVVDLSMSAADLHDSRILYISGNQLLSFTDAERAKLREFVHQGGLILGQPDCNSQQFRMSFQTLGQQLFPEYQFRPLPADHLIFTTYFPATHWGKSAAVLGLSNGAREFMILPETDPAMYWNTGNFSRAKAIPMAGLAADIYVYTKRTRPLDPSPGLIERDDSIKANRTIKIARLEYKGNWNPEPGGWVRLSNMMHNERKIDLDVQPVPLGEGKSTIDYRVAHLTGTGNLQLNQGQRDELKAYVQAGGTVIIDCAGGADVFDTSAQAELAAMFAAETKTMKPLAADDPVYINGGTKIDKVEYRHYARKKLVGEMNTPRLRGIVVGGRTAIYFSREDLSVGLVGTDVDGILGYEPAYASELMANMISVSTR